MKNYTRVSIHIIGCLAVALLCHGCVTHKGKSGAEDKSATVKPVGKSKLKAGGGVLKTPVANTSEKTKAPATEEANLTAVELGRVSRWTLLLKQKDKWVLRSDSGVERVANCAGVVGAGPASGPQEKGNIIVLSSNWNDFVEGTKYYRVELKVSGTDKPATKIMWCKSEEPELKRRIIKKHGADDAVAPAPVSQ